MTPMLFFLIDKAISIFSLIILVDVILSWLPEVRYRYREFSRLLDKVTEPVYRPFRRLISPYKTGGLDLSPMLALISLSIARQIIFRVLTSVLG